MAKPILRVRIICARDTAQALTAKYLDEARALLGAGLTYRTQTRTPNGAGVVTAYITATEEGEPS